MNSKSNSNSTNHVNSNDIIDHTNTIIPTGIRWSRHWSTHAFRDIPKAQCTFKPLWVHGILQFYFVCHIHKSSKRGFVKGGIRMLFANRPVKFRMLFANSTHHWHQQHRFVIRISFADSPHTLRRPAAAVRTRVLSRPPRSSQCFIILDWNESFDYYFEMLDYNSEIIVNWN